MKEKDKIMQEIHVFCGRLFISIGCVDEGNGDIFTNMVKGQKKHFSESQ